ncbi:protein ABHD11-like [Centruroides sculpturatus]|uniref:protein ABHD11-like n=1 Tax=Centruroides sculpturatus TaxID=218467 RepID=UPI000C6EB48D|nr:protein ABHD11-like [Centruroides sculpturatus]
MDKLIRNLLCSDKLENLAYDVYREVNGSFRSAPVVIYHGLFDNKNNWKRIASSLANDLCTKIYAVDMRNHGDSPTSSMLNHEENIKDLNNFLQNIGEPVILIAHSFGGTAAMDLAFNKPQLIKKLILIEASPLRCAENEANRVLHILFHMNRAIAFIRKNNSFSKAKSILEEYFRDKIKIPALYEIIASNLREDTFGINWKVNVMAVEMAIVLHKIFENIYPLQGVYHGKTLMIHTSSSELIGTNDYENLRKCFPNVDFKCVESCSNWIHMENPDELSKIIYEQISNN